jgi:hypothetical protein
MRPQIIEIYADQESSIVLELDVEDENGNAVAPNELYWQLAFPDGSIVNDREAVEITTPTATSTVMLSGADLAVQDGDEVPAVRYLSLYATYDSGDVTDIPLRQEHILHIRQAIAPIIEISEIEEP